MLIAPSIDDESGAPRDYTREHGFDWILSWSSASPHMWLKIHIGKAISPSTGSSRIRSSDQKLSVGMPTNSAPEAWSFSMTCVSSISGMRSARSASRFGTKVCCFGGLLCGGLHMPMGGHRCLYTRRRKKVI